MTVHNLYNYQVLTTTHKILKLHNPISMYSCFKLSQRKKTMLHIPKIVSDSYIYNASSLWNIFRSTAEGSDSKSFSVSIGSMKLKIKSLIYNRQQIGDPNTWYPDINFKLQ